MTTAHSIAILGLAGTGKTHFGGQLIGRLRSPTSKLQLVGAPSDRKLFEDVLTCLQQGVPAEHTPIEQYGEEVLTLRHSDGKLSELAWPDYGGEQLAALLKDRRIPETWRSRLSRATAWALFIRIGAVTVFESAATRPRAISGATPVHHPSWDDNARYVELLQILLHASNVSVQKRLLRPRLAVVVSCWDELPKQRAPAEELREKLPFLSGYLRANWTGDALSIWGLSSLGKSLQKETPDVGYVRQGPESFGYVVDKNGRRNPDLTELVEWLTLV